jgi:hypothetical protein
MEKRKRGRPIGSCKPVEKRLVHTAFRLFPYQLIWLDDKEKGKSLWIREIIDGEMKKEKENS